MESVESQVPEGLPALGCTMRANFTLSGLDAPGQPWAYASRVAEGWDARQIAFMPAFIAVLGSGVGVFMAHDATMGRIPFWSNAVVWFGLIHMGFFVAFAAWMRWGRLIWTAPEMGLASQCLLSIPYGFHFASLWATCFYGSAPTWIRVALVATSLIWHGWWIAHVVKRCQAIWRDPSLRQRVWVCYEPAFVYRQFGAKDAFERVGLRFYPRTAAMVAALFVLILLVWWRRELSTLFGVPFIHVFGILFSPIVTVLGLTFSVFAAMMMLVYPAKIVAETGKPVLVDMMTPADAPVPDACPSASQ